jgi:AcrR family transcriptional regulator
MPERKNSIAGYPGGELMNLASSGTPERILASASHLFAQSGFRNTSVREIASGADVNEITIYRHFKSKKELCCAVLELELQRIQLKGSSLGRLAESQDCRTALFRVIEVIAASFSANPHVIRLIQFGFLEFEDQADILIRKHLGEFVGVLARYLEPWMAQARLRSVNSRALILALVAVILGYRYLARSPETDNMNDIIEELACVFAIPSASASPGQ